MFLHKMLNSHAELIESDMSQLSAKDEDGKNMTTLSARNINNGVYFMLYLEQ